jgi:hypothetical protein
MIKVWFPNRELGFYQNILKLAERDYQSPPAVVRRIIREWFRSQELTKKGEN